MPGIEDKGYYIINQNTLGNSFSESKQKTENCKINQSKELYEFQRKLDKI